MNTAQIKSMLDLCKTKGWDDAVRILDLSEVDGTPLGAACTMQVIEYAIGDWVDVDFGVINSLDFWYNFIRSDLGFDGPIRLAVAGE